MGGLHLVGQDAYSSSLDHELSGYLNNELP